MDNEGRMLLRSIQLFRLKKWWRLSVFYSTLFIFHCSLVTAQTPTREQLTGTWIGVHTEWDIDTYCPLPTYIRLAADSTYTLGLVDNGAPPIVSTWAANDRVIRLDTVQYQPKLITLRGNQLRIGMFYPMTFRRLTPIPLDSAMLYRQLAGRIWQADSLIIHLHNNGRVCLENPATKQRTVHFWQLARMDESVFLIIRGNQVDHNGGYKPLWQIANASSKQMQAIGWYHQAIKTVTFHFVRTLAAGDSCRGVGFQPCNNCFARMWHDLGIGHEDQYALNKLFRTYYQPTSRLGQSGLIRIRFVVNCKGERGLFEVAGFGEDYCPKTFDPQITSQLVQICHEHVPTNFSMYATDLPYTEPLDSAISLTFRLKDGQLTAILP